MDFIFSIRQNYYLCSANDLAIQADTIGDYDISNLVTMYIKYQRYLQKMTPEKAAIATKFRDINFVFEYYLSNFKDDTYEQIINAGFIIQPEHLTFFVKQTKPCTTLDGTIYIKRLTQMITLLPNVEILTVNEKEEIIDSLRPTRRLIYDIDVIQNMISLLGLGKINGTYFLRDCFEYIYEQIVLEAYVDFLLTKTYIDLKNINLKPKFPLLMKRVIHQIMTTYDGSLIIKNFQLDKLIQKANKELNKLKIVSDSCEYNKWKEYIDFLRESKNIPNDLCSS